MKSFKRISYFLGAAPFLLCVVLALHQDCTRSFALCAAGFFLMYLIFAQFWLKPLAKMIETVEGYRKKYKDIEEEKESRKFLNPLSALISTLDRIHERALNQLEYSQAKDREVQGILDSLNEGVVVLDADAKVFLVNQTAAQMLERTSSSILGSSLQSLSNGGDLLESSHYLILRSLQTSESFTEKECRECSHFDLLASPLIHQEGVILVIRDKTADYRMLEMGKNFIANASHELRTPITVIQGFAEVLEDVSTLSPKMIKEIAGKMIRTSARFNTLVKSLLTLADLENKAEHPLQKVDLVTLLENCRHALLSVYPEASCTFHSSQEELILEADRDLLELAVSNLLENAVKYSSDKAKIDLTLEETETEFSLVCKDQGIGIPKEDLPHIFDRFYTVNKERSRKCGGSGLGLSIVKSIMEKHHGSIQVTSEPNKGSEFKMAFSKKQ